MPDARLHGCTACFVMLALMVGLAGCADEGSGWTQFFAAAVRAPAPEPVDFEADTLYVLDGAASYDGPADASAHVRLASDGTALHLTLDVTDDQVEADGSDRVELWLALPDREGRPLETGYVLADSAALYRYDGRGDVAALEAELMDPQVSLYGNYRPSPLVAYSALDTTEGSDEWYARDFVDQLLYDLEGSMLEPVQVFFGVVHLGLFPDGRLARRYDGEAYDLLELETGLTLGPLAGAVNYDAERTARGYRLTAELSPAALGFLPAEGLGGLRFMAVVVDADGNAEPTYLATAADGTPGVPATFDAVVLEKPLLVPGHPPLHLPDGTTPLQDVFMYTANGWQPIVRRVEPLFYPHRLLYVTLPRLEFVQFDRSLVEYEKHQTARHRFEVITSFAPQSASGRQVFVRVDDSLHVTADQFVEAFDFADGTPGLLAATYTYTYGACFASGQCGCAYDVTLWLVRRFEGSVAEGNGPLVTLDGCQEEVELPSGISLDTEAEGMTLFETVYTADSWDPSGEIGGLFVGHVDWQALYRWETPGRRLRLNLGPDLAYSLSFGERGASVQAEAVGAAATLPE